MKLSLIVTTYNWKEALALCLRSAFAQERLPDEIIVADDGSRPDTAELVAELAEQSPVPLLHTWHPDTGFRLSASRNNGVAASTGDYLIFVDGDTVLPPHFCADHVRFARPGRWILGKRILTDAARAKRILDTGDARVHLFSRGISKRINAVRSLFLATCVSPLVYRLRDPFDPVTPWGGYGVNMSHWRSDVIRVNGFNEDFTGWGGEDNEFNARLDHVGVLRTRVRFAAQLLHIHHPSGKSDGDRNQRILDDTVNHRKTWCENGVDKRLAGECRDVVVRSYPGTGHRGRSDE